MPTLASWHHAEWSHLNSGMTLEDRLEMMELYLSDSPIPSTFVCIDKNKPIGSAAVIEHDMDTHKELSPWLASVFVKPEFRNQGIGSRLIQHVMQYTKQLGIDEFYLFTEDKEDFYSNLGWIPLFEETYRNVEVIVMKTIKNG